MRVSVIDWFRAAAGAGSTRNDSSEKGSRVLGTDSSSECDSDASRMSDEEGSINGSPVLAPTSTTSSGCARRGGKLFDLNPLKKVFRIGASLSCPVNSAMERKETRSPRRESVDGPMKCEVVNSSLEVGIEAPWIEKSLDSAVPSPRSSRFPRYVLRARPEKCKVFAGGDYIKRNVRRYPKRCSLSPAQVETGWTRGSVCKARANCRECAICLWKRKRKVSNSFLQSTRTLEVGSLVSARPQEPFGCPVSGAPESPTLSSRARRWKYSLVACSHYRELFGDSANGKNVNLVRLWREQQAIAKIRRRRGLSSNRLGSGSRIFLRRNVRCFVFPPRGTIHLEKVFLKVHCAAVAESSDVNERVLRSGHCLDSRPLVRVVRSCG